MEVLILNRTPLNSRYYIMSIHRGGLCLAQYVLSGSCAKKSQPTNQPTNSANTIIEREILENLYCIFCYEFVMLKNSV